MLLHEIMTRVIGALYLAPIDEKTTHRILDIGTGTGICETPDVPRTKELRRLNAERGHIYRGRISWRSGKMSLTGCEIGDQRVASPDSTPDSGPVGFSLLTNLVVGYWKRP